MNQKVLPVLLLSIFMFLAGFSKAQEVDVYRFEDFKKLLDKEDGKIYVINFWATWCGPCVKELPAFQKLHDQYKDLGVEVILVSLDFEDQLKKRVIPFVESRKLSPRVILLDEANGNQWIDHVSPEWSGAIPATLIYSSRSRMFYERSFTFEELEEIVKSKFLL